MTVQLPQNAEVIVIGGGIIGCSTAYHLARDHKANVILLEQNKITSGSTWHAAGLVGQLRSSASITQVLKYSVDLYKKLEAETGLQTGWKMTGCLRLATNQDRWIEFKRLATTAQSFGMDMQLLSPAETRKLWPLLEVSDLVGSTFLPTDGQASPSDITQALAKGARMHGAKIFEGVGVTGFEIKDGRVTAVHTTSGTVKCERVVNCGGQWAKQIGAKAGVSVPLQPVKHQYVITEKLEGLAKDAPTIRDPDRRTYFKEEVGGLVFGGYEPNPISWDVAEVPSNFEFQLFDDDFDHFEQHMAEALERIPALGTTGIKKMINGPESFTPDGNFILGRAPELKNFYMGCGFNAFGIASGGGAGWVLADWVMKGEAPTDLWSVDIRRFSGLHRDRQFTRDRTLEAYGKHYTIGFPHEEYQSGRPKLVSPLYDRLKAAGACFGSKLGWERPNWFAPAGTEAKDIYSMGRQNWFATVGAEHRATREKAGLFDQSSFAKFELRGADAYAALQYICANQMPKADGRLVYTQLLNTRGGIECDLTIARLAADHFYIVTGTGFRTHDYHWIEDHIPAGMDAKLSDITEAWGTLSLMGPQSRAMLQAVSADDVSAFKFGDARYVTLAGHRILCLRVTYVGELGFELHGPIAALPAVYDALIAQGAVNCGYRAIESLRLEKGYRAWSSDITANDSPLEAGLGWAVKLKSNEDFIGRKALEAQRAAPLKKMMVGFTTEREDIVLVGRETILRDGKFAGYLTSGGYGYTVAKPIGYGYLRNAEGVTEEWARAGSYELVVAQERVKASLHLGALYDPSNEKVKA
ncbi:MAG: GcvT family protein [Alphaproteobacteria bacterium]|nr:GcvT family protein [Alphaproteobacteria bacterium]